MGVANVEDKHICFVYRIQTRPHGLFISRNGFYEDLVYEVVCFVDHNLIFSGNTVFID